jgi:phage tail-like protein
MAGPPAELVNPFHTYNFLVKWDGNYVAAVTSISGLTRRTAVVSFHAGGQPQSPLRIPGQTDYEPVRLERGITTDTAFQDWANLMWDYPSTQQLGNETPLATFRKRCRSSSRTSSGSSPSVTTSITAGRASTPRCRS